MLTPVYLTARDLPDAWFQAIDAILNEEFNNVYIIDKGSFKGQKRMNLDYITVHIKYPGTKPLIPDIPPFLNIPAPTTMEYVDDYFANYLAPYAEHKKKENEQYTYGERIKISYDRIVSVYKQGNYGSNQEIIQVGAPEDINMPDPPCLRHIDTRVKDNKLHFFLYFRSWDLWGGFPANLAGLQLLKELMAQDIGVEDGEMIVASKGLHLYDYVWELAKLRRRK